MAAGLGAVAMAAGGLGILAPPAQAHTETPYLPEGDWTEEQVHAAEELVQRTEQVLPQHWSDSSQLEEHGFFDFGATAPGGYDHYINPSWMADDHLLDPEFPESLVYQRQPDGSHELVAAMFYLSVEHSMDNIPEEYAWWPGWHVHEELCVNDQGEFTGIVGPDGTCAVGQPSVSPPMMHVWIVDNECGHRFGGLGVTGLMCDVGSHGPGHPDDPGEPDDPGGPHEPGEPDQPHEPAPEQPGGEDPPDTGGETPPPANPAQPIVAEPDYTG